MNEHPCRLCQRNVPLASSHVVPAFVYRWIKDTSLTGKLSSGDRPGYPVQDGHRFPLLCFECEQVLAVDERSFREKLWVPLHSDSPPRTIEYESWLARFLAGLSLKIAFFADHRTASASAARVLYDRAVPQWRDFLLGRSRSFGDYPFYFVVTHARMIPPSSDPVVTRKLPWYLLRGTDIEFPFSRTGGASLMCVMPKLMLWVALVPNRRRASDWPNSRIRRDGTISTSGATVSEAGLVDFLHERIRRQAELTSLTPAQSAALTRRAVAAVDRNPERAWESLSVWAKEIEDELLATSRILGGA